MPIISRFLEMAKLPVYRGFPRLGVSFAPLRDPQLRRYIGLTEPGGIYVTKVAPKSSAASAGLREGDVILAVNGRALDQDGNYEDADYGRILFSHITGTLTPTGGKVVVKILRSGKIEEVPVPMEPLDRSGVVSPSFLADAAPPYFILGGMVFVELSRPYLQEWGAEWTKNAPQRLVNYDAFQDELPADRGKIVVASIEANRAQLMEHYALPATERL
jgi:membrane-associated protease RseP (regulator of RpoE activity)